MTHPLQGAKVILRCFDPTFEEVDLRGVPAMIKSFAYIRGVAYWSIEILSLPLPLLMAMRQAGMNRDEAATVYLQRHDFNFAEFTEPVLVFLRDEFAKIAREYVEVQKELKLAEDWKASLEAKK